MSKKKSEEEQKKSSLYTEFDSKMADQSCRYDYLIELLHLSRLEVEVSDSFSPGEK